MKGSSLLFMVFSWMTIFGFVVFCFTVILREGNRTVKRRAERELFEEVEEIT